MERYNDDMPFNQEGETAAPSAEFINAISAFLDTDPKDLLVELGYYQRDGEALVTGTQE